VAASAREAHRVAASAAIFALEDLAAAIRELRERLGSQALACVGDAVGATPTTIHGLYAQRFLAETLNRLTESAEIAGHAMDEMREYRGQI
jgi:predicted alpha/beta hydrolase